jgi:hypothetical protein
VSAPSQRPANERFIRSYNATFHTAYTTATSPGNAYDAVYLVAYAAQVADEGGRTGASLARALGRLTPPGKPFDVGPEQLLDVQAALRRGERVDLQGTISPLDFDLATGESATEFEYVCLVRRGGSWQTEFSGLRYEPGGAIVGEMACPGWER